MNYQTGGGEVMETPTFVVSQAEVWVVWGPHLWLVSETGAVL